MSQTDIEWRYLIGGERVVWLWKLIVFSCPSRDTFSVILISSSAVDNIQRHMTHVTETNVGVCHNSSETRQDYLPN